MPPPHPRNVQLHCIHNQKMKTFWFITWAGTFFLFLFFKLQRVLKAFLATDFKKHTEVTDPMNC